MSELRPDDIYQQVARLHAAGINQGFLSSLGERFLVLLYRCIDECPESVLLVETSERNVVGFVSGASRMRPIYLRMLAHLPTLVYALLPSLFSYTRLKKILEVLKYSGNSTNKVDLPDFELLSIVVSIEARGSGCSEKLYRKLKNYCKQSGIDQFKIIVGDQLEAAHGFYRRMGAVAVSQIEVHAGEGSTVYVHDVR